MRSLKPLSLSFFVLKKRWEIGKRSLPFSFFCNSMHIIHSNKWKEFFFPLKKLPRHYIIITFLVITVSLVNILNVEFLRQLSQAIETQNKQQFIYMLWGLIAIKCFRPVFERYKKQSDRPTLAKTRQLIYEKYMQKFLCLNASQAESIGTWKTISIVQKGYENRADMHYEVFSVWLRQVCTIIVSITYLFIYSWQAFWVWIAIVLIVILLWSAILKAENKVKKETKETSMDITRLFVRQIMSKYEILQAGKTRQELQNMQKLRQKFIQNKLREVPYKWSLHALLPFLIAIGEIIWYSYIWYGVFQGTLTLSDLVVFVTIFWLINRMVGGLVNRFRSISRKTPHIEKLRKTFEKNKPIYWYHTGNTFVHKKWDITLDAITFGYKWNKALFDKFSLTLQWWKKTALVGSSGSWKSTLAKLIAWYLSAQQWHISIDNQNLPQNKKIQDSSHVSLQSYYKHIWFLTQDPGVFDGTIYENLCYWLDSKPSNNRVEEIITLSACEFIYDLPQWIDTHIGERGVRLSWGQRQRLAIAKVFLKNPEIIILDEPTSALDSISEELVTQAMHSLFKNRTVIIIAHRLQTVKEADEIIVMKKWKVIERGKHHELVQKKWQYAKLLKLQTGF